MTRGPLFEISRRSSTSALNATLIALCLFAGVLGLSYRFFYNWWTGPVPFTAALSQDPGLHRWVRAEGLVLPTGLATVTKLKLLKGLAQSEHVSARYSAMLVGGKPLIIISDNELRAKQTVEGAIAPLPDDVRGQLGLDNLHPWLLDARTSYRIWQANLSVWIVLPLFGLGLLVLAVEIPGRLKPMRAVLAKAARYGDPVSIIEHVEAELRGAGVGGRDGQIWLTRSWLVGAWDVDVVRLADQVAVGFTVKDGRAEVTCWERGRADAVVFRAPEPEVRAVLERLKRSHPPLAVTDVKAFDERWKADRLGCEAAADAAVAAARAAAAAPAPPVPARSA